MQRAHGRQQWSAHSRNRDGRKQEQHQGIRIEELLSAQQQDDIPSDNGEETDQKKGGDERDLDEEPYLWSEDGTPTLLVDTCDLGLCGENRNAEEVLKRLRRE